MQPQDLWAIANLKYPQLPPPEYDYYPDKLVITEDIKTEAELRVRCRWPPLDGKSTIIGCATVVADVCYIYLGPIPDWTGITRNINLRHEMGHCNGWGKDHAGIR
jgi:hypothetical protein